MKWSTADAKQNLSEVLRRARQEPQEILNRNRLAAVVLSPEEYHQFDEWRRSRSTNLAGAFSEVRELFARYDYELPTLERQDRTAWPDEEWD